MKRIWTTTISLKIEVEEEKQDEANKELHALLDHLSHYDGSKAVPTVNVKFLGRTSFRLEHH